MVPTLSQIEAYSTDHLVDAADHWDSLADRWEDAHWQVRNQAHVLDWQARPQMLFEHGPCPTTPLPAAWQISFAARHASPVNRRAYSTSSVTVFSTQSRTPITRDSLSKKIFR